ncbi:MAG: hypothetical protein Kapaf2KO_00490 [Candidatus Kapaibacteriales bacterium]
MENNLLIEGFLDGSLSSAEEDTLFQNFLYDKDLRKQLTSSLNLEKELTVKSAAMLPTSTETAGVFSALGFSPSAASSVVSGTAATGGITSGFITGVTGGSWWSAMAASLLAFVGAYGIYVGFDSGEKSFAYKEPLQASEKASKQNFNSTDIAAELKDSISNLNAQIKVLEEEKRVIAELKSKTLIKPDSQQKNTIVEKRKISSNTPAKENILGFKQPGTSIDSKPYILQMRQVDVQASDIAKVSYDLINRAIDKDNGFGEFYDEGFMLSNEENPVRSANSLRLELIGGFDLTSVPEGFDAGLAGEGIAGLALYKLNNNLEIGLGYSRRAYYLEYQNGIGDDAFNYSQYTLYPSLELMLQYLPLGNRDGLYPLVRFGGGASEIGPVGSVAAGVYYPVSDNIDLQLSYSAGLQTFVFQNVLYSGISHGLNAGVSFAF